MKKYILIVLAILFVLYFPKQVCAFWVWTPETNKWTNPKLSVKETPEEQLKYAHQFREAKQYKEATREFEKLIRHYPRAREASEAQFYIGICYEDQDLLYRAFKEYQTVIDKYPFSNLAEEVVKHQYDIGEELLEGRSKKNKFVQAVMGTNYNVIDVFRAVIKNAPYGQWAAPSQYKIGLYLMENGLFDEARDEFEKVINDYPASEWVKAAKYQIAAADSKRSTSAQYDQKITQSAVKEFKDFVEVYPDAELTDEAKGQIQGLREKEAHNHFVVAEFYQKQKNIKAAKIYYEAIVKDYSTTSWAKKALQKIRTLKD